MRMLCALAAGVALFADLRVELAAAADATICRYLSQLPDDCGGATQQRFGNLQNYRYVEIDLFSKDVLKKSLYRASYNTTGQNGGDETQDSAPQSVLQTLNTKALAKQYQALSVQISRPRYWRIDWLSDRVGVVRNFGGLDAVWMGDAPASLSAEPSKAPAKTYRSALVPRTAIAGFKKGTKVNLLDDSNNRAWVMLSSSEKTLDKLDRLAELLVLPPGWKLRTLVLSKDLILEAKSGSAVVTEDDSGDQYNLTGPGQSNFTP
jgi:hypothetical protein